MFDSITDLLARATEAIGRTTYRTVSWIPWFKQHQGDREGQLPPPSQAEPPQEEPPAPVGQIPGEPWHNVFIPPLGSPARPRRLPEHEARLTRRALHGRSIQELPEGAPERVAAEKKAQRAREPAAQIPAEPVAATDRASNQAQRDQKHTQRIQEKATEAERRYLEALHPQRHFTKKDVERAETARYWMRQYFRAIGHGTPPAPQLEISPGGDVITIHDLPAGPDGKHHLRLSLPERVDARVIGPTPPDVSVEIEHRGPFGDIR